MEHLSFLIRAIVDFLDLVLRRVFGWCDIVFAKKNCPKILVFVTELTFI
jgi:hypothetical protein